VTAADRNYIVWAAVEVELALALAASYARGGDAVTAAFVAGAASGLAVSAQVVAQGAAAAVVA